jgi:hypothetical protein
MLEHAQPQDLKSRCEPSREFAAEDLLVVFRRDYKEVSSDTARPGGPTTGLRVPPDDKGLFEVRNLQPGRYRPEAYLPDENWYVRAISMPAPARSKTSRASMIPTSHRFVPKLLSTRSSVQVKRTRTRS